MYRRGHKGGKTGEIPHPSVLGQGQGGEEGGEFPHPVMGPKTKKCKHICKNFCNFLVINSTFKNDTFKNIKIVNSIVLFYQTQQPTLSIYILKSLLYCVVTILTINMYIFILTNNLKLM